MTAAMPNAALTKISAGELGRKASLAIETERGAPVPRMVEGRQILWMIHDYHKYDEEYDAVLNFTDLLSVRTPGA